MKTHKQKHEVSAKEKTSILVALALSVLVSVPMIVSGQPAVNSPVKLKSSKTISRMTRNQFSKLIPAIERQTESLNKIFAKYSERGISDSGPFWQQSGIWNDLLRSRHVLRNENGGNLTIKQRAQLDAACFQLETELLSFLLDGEIPYWAELLELTPRQVEVFFRLVSSDVKTKHSFLQKFPDKDLLDQKLKGVSDATEQKINKVLLDDQRDEWEKVKQRSLVNGSKLVA